MCVSEILVSKITEKKVIPTGYANPRNCKYWDSDDQIEQRICRRYGNVLPSEASRRDTCGIIEGYLDHVDFSIHRNRLFV